MEYFHVYHPKTSGHLLYGIFPGLFTLQGIGKQPTTQNVYSYKSDSLLKKPSVVNSKHRRLNEKRQ